jgi:hypothetical protein
MLKSCSRALDLDAEYQAVKVSSWDEGDGEKVEHLLDFESIPNLPSSLSSPSLHISLEYDGCSAAEMR